MRDARRELSRRLAAGPALLLDGATGTELERRGIGASLPLWSTHALLDEPDAVHEIHRDYARAGADVLTANTFRTQRRTLERAGIGERAAELTALAVELARRAAGAELQSVPWIAGSAPPLEDCYRPDRVPDPDDALREHREHAANLARAGADLILIETMNDTGEAAAAARAARETGLPFLVSFVAWDGARLISGESLAVAVERVVGFEPLALLVNCLPPSNVTACLDVLRDSGLPFGVYPNLGEPGVGGRRAEELAPEELAKLAVTWIEAGARIVGGCCGTRPDHVAALATARTGRD